MQTRETLFNHAMPRLMPMMKSKTALFVRWRSLAKPQAESPSEPIRKL